MAYGSTLIRSRATPLGITAPGLSFLPVRDGLWRVTTVTGAILGHIERGESGAERGQRFTARALLSDGVHYSELGEFGDAQTAAECFR
ncbi:hypothetical protein ASC66_17530 [Leifsonia sp. Root4]|uniref:hypothetical protein n=1 Tax=Leifsonia sp. Root4 TaxID=1736525 RepID=UPI0006FBA2FD|nr:hypothetical protein [Leifsonia sp. Root4]KQW03539.1 hypothetical protein ASC66_17530 [Leifsonia sp. Root4]